jgi:hypothetical protein
MKNLIKLTNREAELEKVDSDPQMSKKEYQVDDSTYRDFASYNEFHNSENDDALYARDRPDAVTFGWTSDVEPSSVEEIATEEEKSIIKQLYGCWIQTFTGKRFDLLNPKLHQIDIVDIAHALSMQCRFGGMSQRFYSVSQHSVLVSYLVGEKDALHGLLHDASEAYLADVTSPLKHSGRMEGYLALEKHVQGLICQKFGLSEIEPPSVKRADKLMLAIESKTLMSPRHPDWHSPVETIPFHIDPLSQEESKKEFLRRFHQLTKK